MTEPNLNSSLSIQQKLEEETCASTVDNDNYQRPPDQLYVFDCEDSAVNIKYQLFDPDSQEYLLEYVSLDKLIEWVTHEKHLALDLRTALLYTYRLYTTPQEVLLKLKQRYQVPIPPNMSKT